MATMTAAAGVLTPMFKDNLRRLREAKGWTQADTARRANVPLRSYQNWEEGVREPRLDALVRLATAFGVDFNELLEGVSGQTDQPPAPEPPPPPTRPKGKKKK